MATVNESHVGSSFSDFLEEDGMEKECEAVAIKRVIAWQLANYMKDNNVTKTFVARQMGINHSLINSIFDNNDTSITIATMFRIAKVIDQKLQFGFCNKLA